MPDSSTVTACRHRRVERPRDDVQHAVEVVASGDERRRALDDERRLVGVQPAVRPTTVR
jgi:hypothetical protein